MQATRDRDRDDADSPRDTEAVPLLHSPVATGVVRAPSRLPPLSQHQPPTVPRVTSAFLASDDVSHFLRAQSVSTFLDSDAVVALLSRDASVKYAPESDETPIETPDFVSKPTKDLFSGLRPHAALGEFRQVIGEIPFCEPNVRAATFEADIGAHVPVERSSWCELLCCWPRAMLVERGHVRFSSDSGAPRAWFAGWHTLVSPLHEWTGEPAHLGEAVIRRGPVTLVRVQLGSVGLATDDGRIIVLLPGWHVHNAGAFHFDCFAQLDAELTEFHTLKMFNVRSGTVRVCYDHGRACVYDEGRYAVNRAAFCVASAIDVRDRLVRIADHAVLLCGGVTLLVSALLVVRVVDARRLVTQLLSGASSDFNSKDGNNNGNAVLDAALQNTTRAALARVFASAHLEQISAPASADAQTSTLVRLADVHQRADTIGGSGGGNGAPAVLGGALDAISSREGAFRARLCDTVHAEVAAAARAWGVDIVSVQLSTTRLANLTFAADYERASLQLALVNAQLRSVALESEITVASARAHAECACIIADGERAAAVTLARARAVAVATEAEARVGVAAAGARALATRIDGEAHARTIEARARQSAAATMCDAYARRFALNDQRVQFASVLRARVLTVQADDTEDVRAASTLSIAASVRANATAASRVHASGALRGAARSSAALLTSGVQSLSSIVSQQSLTLHAHVESGIQVDVVAPVLARSSTLRGSVDLVHDSAQHARLTSEDDV